MSNGVPGRIPFAGLAAADLIVDAVYEGGSSKRGRADDPIHPLLGVGNAGGFRLRGKQDPWDVRYVVLYTSGSHPDWPDVLDPETGAFTYHGDQRTPGLELHDTKRGGNRFLRTIFSLARGDAENRTRVPPIFLFESAGESSHVRFKGLLVPGGPSGRPEQQLVAFWRLADSGRFQNYVAQFTVLDASPIPRAWITDLAAGDRLSPHAPDAWKSWTKSGVPRALRSERQREYRKRAQQMPNAPQDKALLELMYKHFAGRPTDFEACAAALWQLAAPSATVTEITRPTKDHGRDAFGYYSLGPADDRVRLSFSLEAKCYSPTSSVGTREISRLISRIRHREFGVLVTTSYVHEQAYQEVREDQHPIVILAGKDLVDILKGNSLGTAARLQDWLNTEFPPHG
jgi:hypothetical protein